MCAAEQKCDEINSNADGAAVNTVELECSSCFNDLEDDEYISALGQEWHADCFRCSACDALLSSWYFEKDGLLFCKNDYWTQFGESCQQCGEVRKKNSTAVVFVLCDV